MAELPFGNREVILYGLDEPGLAAVHSRLGEKGVNLAAPTGLVSRVAVIRALPEILAGGTEWSFQVDQLSTEVESVERSIKEADLSRYTLGRMGIVLPNPEYTKSEQQLPAPGGKTSVSRTFSGAKPFLFLGKEELLVRVLPQNRDRFERGLEQLAVAVSFKETLR